MYRIIVPYEGKSERITVPTSRFYVQCHMKSGVLSPVYVCYCMILLMTLDFDSWSGCVCAVCAALSAGTIWSPYAVSIFLLNYVQNIFLCNK
jgi:hypothetical protein